MYMCRFVVVFSFLAMVTNRYNRTDDNISFTEPTNDLQIYLRWPDFEHDTQQSLFHVIMQELNHEISLCGMKYCSSSFWCLAWAASRDCYGVDVMWW